MKMYTIDELLSIAVGARATHPRTSSRLEGLLRPWSASRLLREHLSPADYKDAVACVRYIEREDCEPSGWNAGNHGITLEL